jgi:TonB family protein
MDSLFYPNQDRQEWITLAQLRPARRRHRLYSFSAAAGVHILLLAWLAWPSLPIFVKPNFVARGEGGNATPVSLAFYVPNDLRVAPQTSPPLLSLPTRPRTKPKPQKSQMAKRTNTVEVEKPTGSLEAGSTQGSGYDGLTSGDEVRPALPVTFPDLKLSRSELPGGVQGDVIVEVTIDAQGVIVEEKLLQGLGHGIDERVIALLHDWRYRPATRNGVPIPSKHDVHFHFPS